jgi:hypothetical protein
MAKRSLFRAALVGVLAMMWTSLAPAVMVAPTPVQASSHREAPLISQDPSADATDLYLFVSPERPDTLTFIMNWIPYEKPNGGPNWYRFGDDVLYELHVDNNGDAQEDITYEWRFKTLVVNGNTFLHNIGVVGENMDREYNLRQYMYMDRLDAPKDGSCKDTPLANCAAATRTTLLRDKEVAPANVGPASFPVYPITAAKNIHDVGTTGAKVFAGPRADSFFGDIGSLFDLLTIRNLPGNAGGGINSFAGHNVHTIALQTPIRRFTSDASTPTDANGASSVIGAWITSSRRATTVLGNIGDASGFKSSTGSWVQIERLGMPLVNEIVVPLGVKDTFNNLKPFQDGAALPIVQDPEPARLLNALYGLKVPPTPRNDIVTVFLTGIPGLNKPANVTPSEMLRLNVAIKPSATPNPMGVLGKDLAGFPNGRRPIDDVIDIELRVVAGILVDPNLSPNNVLGDGVDKPARFSEFTSTFPYLALPYNGYYYQTLQQEDLDNSGGNNYDEQVP